MVTITVSDGCRLVCDVAGEGETVLLIPGLGGMAAFWSAVTPRLAERYRVVSFDHRGTGRSDRPEGAYSIPLMARDAAEILRGLGVEKAHVVGHSTGGMIAQHLALDHADLVGRLVISGSWDQPDARFRTMFEARLAVLLEAGPKTYQKLTHAIGYPAAYLEAHAEALAAVVEAAEGPLSPLGVAAARIEMLQRDDRAEDLARIRAATLVLGARDDALIPFYHAERLAAAIPGARLAALDGGHFYPKVHPERFAALVRQFLEQDHA